MNIFKIWWAVEATTHDRNDSCSDWWHLLTRMMVFAYVISRGQCTWPKRLTNFIPDWTVLMNCSGRGDRIKYSGITSHTDCRVHRSFSLRASDLGLYGFMLLIHDSMPWRRHILRRKYPSIWTNKANFRFNDPHHTNRVSASERQRYICNVSAKQKHFKWNS